MAAVAKRYQKEAYSCGSVRCGFNVRRLPLLLVVLSLPSVPHCPALPCPAGYLLAVAGTEIRRSSFGESVTSEIALSDPDSTIVVASPLVLVPAERILGRLRRPWHSLQVARISTV